MGLLSGSLYVRVSMHHMFSGPGSIQDGLARALYYDVSDSTSAM